MISQEYDNDKLRTIYKRCQKADGEIFVSTLGGEFFEELEQQHLIEAFDEHAAIKEAEDKHTLLTYEQDILQILRQQHKEIATYYAKHSIVLPEGFMGRTGISEFQAYEQGQICSTNSLIDSLTEAIRNELSLLMYINTVEMRAIIKSFCVLDKNGRILGLRDRSIKSLQSMYAELNNYLAREKIVHPLLNQYLEEFCISANGLENCDMQLRQNSALVYILGILSQGDIKSIYHLDFVKQYASVDNIGNIINLAIEHDIQLWHMEKQRIERIQTGTFWYQWQQLKRFYIIYKNYEHMRYEALMKGDLIAEWQLCEDFKKVKGIVSGKQQQGYIKILKAYQQKIFAQIKIMLLPKDQATLIAIQDIKKPEANPNLINFDDVTKTLSIGSNKIVFPRNTGISKEVLRTITKDKESQQKKWSWDEIHQKIEFKEPPKKPYDRQKCRRKYYDSYTHINSQVLKQSGGTIKQFLIYDINQCQINPVYINI